jgi:uncharacterized protein (UPF0212 family)
MDSALRAAEEAQKVQLGNWVFFECPACEEKMDQAYHKCPFCRERIEWVSVGAE